MASRHVENSSDRYRKEDVSGLAEEVKKHLILRNKGNFKWSGSFDSLKAFIEDLLDTRWTSPGGGCKLLYIGKVVIHWYPNFLLIVKGRASNSIKIQLLTMAEENSNDLNNGGEKDSIFLTRTWPTTQIAKENIGSFLQESNAFSV